LRLAASRSNQLSYGSQEKEGRFPLCRLSRIWRRRQQWPHKPQLGALARKRGSKVWLTVVVGSVLPCAPRCVKIDLPSIAYLASLVGDGWSDKLWASKPRAARARAPQNPATLNRNRDHMIAAAFYSQMLYQLSYARLVMHGSREARRRRNPTLAHASVFERAAARSGRAPRHGAATLRAWLRDVTHGRGRHGPCGSYCAQLVSLAHFCSA
jgi:hypothetical protein